ncbi:hypothetical protein RHSIM_Rhsim01G0109100 [Rhododendron simsii]|uniref:Uncharacterized protein n=1 Tax=Rhododendron simsii TaxID=118357 RepID=A0A834HV29_RHOSS|nr:hypothetical protein RHSIM_Rhsim01G0109100 [Rhododendron simsii]
MEEGERRKKNGERQNHSLEDGDERSHLIKEVIQTGVIPRYVDLRLLGTKIASGTTEHNNVVIDHGAVPIFVKLLGSPSYDVREQVNEHAKLSMLRKATWTLSKFCWGKTQVCFDEVGLFDQRLIHSNDEGVLTYACEALSYLSDGSNYRIQAVIEARSSPASNAEFDIKEEAAWAISNAARGVGKSLRKMGYLYAQMIKDMDGLEKIEKLQSHNNSEI